MSTPQNCKCSPLTDLYTDRKNEIVTNVFGVCTPNMQFVYVLPWWEDFAIDGKVLRDVIRRRNGLKISQRTV